MSYSLPLIKDLRIDKYKYTGHFLFLAVHTSTWPERQQSNASHIQPSQALRKVCGLRYRLCLLWLSSVGISQNPIPQSAHSVSPLSHFYCMANWSCLFVCLCVYLQGQSIMGARFFPLCFIWAVKSSGGIDVNLPLPHRWFAASMFVQHDSLTLKGIAIVPHYPNIGFTNEPVATIVIAFYFSSVTLNYLSPRATSGLFQRYLCVCICVQLLSMWDSIWDDVW